MEYKDFVSLRDVKRFSKARVIKKIKKLSHDGWGQNALLLQASPVLYMLPHNDGQPTFPFILYPRTFEEFIKPLANAGFCLQEQAA